MNIGKKVKQRRTELGWSQRELAKRMGYGHHSTITKIESGDVDVPQSRIVQLAEVLTVPVSYLMDWEEVDKKNDALSDIVIRMRTDDNFLSLVEVLNGLDADQIISVKHMLSTLLK